MEICEDLDLLEHSSARVIWHGFARPRQSPCESIINDRCLLEADKPLAQNSFDGIDDAGVDQRFSLVKWSKITLGSLTEVCTAGEIDIFIVWSTIPVYFAFNIGTCITLIVTFTVKLQHMIHTVTTGTEQRACATGFAPPTLFHCNQSRN